MRFPLGLYDPADPLVGFEGRRIGRRKGGKEINLSKRTKK